MTASVRGVAQGLAANLPLGGVQTLSERLDQSLAGQRSQTRLLTVFGLLALLLSAIGIYGVMAYFVAQRTQELGIRLALGAQTSDVLRLVVGQGIKLIAIGLVLGLVGAWAATRVLKSLLFGVSATDPLTFVAIALLLAFVALLACWLPARRAAKVDPLVALRCE